MTTTRENAPGRRPLGQADPPSTATRVAALIALAWAVVYAPACLAWALGAGGSPLGHGQAVLDVLAPPGGALLLGAAAVAAGWTGVALLRDRIGAGWTVLALVSAVVPALTVADVRLLSFAGYLPIVLARAVTGRLEPETLAQLLNWPTLNMVFCSAAGVALLVLAGHGWTRTVRPLSCGGSAWRRRWWRSSSH